MLACCTACPACTKNSQMTKIWLKYVKYFYLHNKMVFLRYCLEFLRVNKNLLSS